VDLNRTTPLEARMRVSLNLLLIVFILSSWACTVESHGQSVASPHTLSTADISQMQNKNFLALDLNLIKSTPSVLNDQSFLKYFTSMNNCSNRQIVHQIDSEFDYPKLAEFYKTRGSEIAAIAPSKLTVSYSLFLGNYDDAKKAFPFMDNFGRPAVPFVDHIDFVRSSSGVAPCFSAVNYDHPDFRISTLFRYGFPNYSIKFAPVAATALVMDEGAARGYVASLANPRSKLVNLIVDLEITPVPPTLRNTPNRPPVYVFTGKITGINVYDAISSNHELLGTLTP
jgi:hypothetical protein